MKLDSILNTKTVFNCLMFVLPDNPVNTKAAIKSKMCGFGGGLCGS